MGKVEPIAAQDEPDNMAIWDVLAKTDPAQTKGFKRGGGFTGTAIKPIWIVKRLTEQFGPCGTGWGMEKPSFETVPGDNREVLVFCTVAGWYTERGERHHVFGVGGDKVVTYIKANTQYNRAERWESDDEAFKKAYTDALGNAFKFLGVGADVHMGLFDDSKYVASMAEEFSPKPEPEVQRKAPVKLAGPHTSKTALWAAVKAFDREVRGCGDLDSLLALLATADTIALMAQVERDAPQLAHGGDTLPAEFEPLHALIARMKTDLEAAETDDSWKRDVTRAG